MKPKNLMLVQMLMVMLMTVSPAFELTSHGADTTRRPNILVILADDVGYSDIGCYGGEISTPNLDSLATGGVRFTQFYNTARCCPTRASLLTGLHPHQAGVGHMMENNGHEGYRGDLNRRCVTIAEALKMAGYRSYAAGKWHVTPGHSANALTNTHNWPLQRGFDRFYGTIHGAGSFFDPSSLVRDNRIITVANDPEYRPAGYYYTDAIADHAVRFIREHARDNREQPFFLYTAFTAAHWPLHAKESDIARYKGRYDGGYEPVRAARLAKMKSLGLVKKEWPLPTPAENWEDVKDKAFESRCMEVYAAQMDSMDQGIGRIIAELKAQGQFENTLILYLQDNGGCAEGIGRGTGFSARGTGPSLPVMPIDAQQFGSTPKQTRDGWPVRMGYGVMPGGPDTYIAYGRGWAQVSNTPFREYKHWTHEGGISTPLIAHWPAGIPSRRRGVLEKQPGQLVDIMATCLDLAGAKYPATHGGEKITPVEGASLRPAFLGKGLDRVRPLVWEHEGNRAVRDGHWKLVAKENRAWELYDLEEDRTELNDLSARHPERVQKMAATWETWAARAGVEPLGAWRGNMRTSVGIVGEDFHINGRPTYPGRFWNGHRIEGLLLNSRMVQATFDDLNPETAVRWAYSDTGKWDAERNVREFIAAMPEWKRHGLLAFTANFQGGSPEGYSSKQTWESGAFEADGTLRPAFANRMRRVLNAADAQGMVVILGYFYFGQDQRLRDEAAVIRATDEATAWLLDGGWRNVMVELNNETNVKAYDHEILKPDRIHELIDRVRNTTRNGRRLLVGTSYGGGAIPESNVVRASDFLLLHGNGVKDPARITEMIRQTRAIPGYRTMPILFNEDDHEGFDQRENNFAAAMAGHVSWGWFDYRRKGEAMEEGYQSPPVNWGISSNRKRAFFNYVAEISGVQR